MTIIAADLRAERLVNPIGIGTSTPRLSWKLIAANDETDVVQTAWQVQVGAADTTWDSGPIDGREQSITYAGPPLGSRDERWWRVKVWTNTGETDWSNRSTFEIGLLEADDWSAQMITADATTPVVRFAKTFDVEGMGSARLHLTAHGLLAATINGAPVSDEVFAPGWTTYNERLAVRTHDVTDLLRDGTNEIVALVAPGWFSGVFGLRSGGKLYGAHVGVFAQLEMRQDDGSITEVVTNTTWSSCSTPYRLAEIYDGETFDAADDVGEPAMVRTVDLDPSILFAPSVPPVRRTETLLPLKREKLADGTLAVDFGQNLVGWLRVIVGSASAGDEIVMRHAEVLDAEGRLFTEPLRAAKATDTYIARGEPLETYEPAFTFHGFRYAEITGGDDVEVEAVVVHTDLERTGTFESSDDLLDRLHANVVWGWRGNSLSVPTDCPQRDERLGWTGDAQVFSPTASYLYDCETFWENWLADLAADQRDDGMVPPVIPDIRLGIGDGAAGWGDAAVIVPWTTYQAYGDDTVLRRSLPSMQRWVDYVHSRLDGDLRWGRDFQFGDWLDPDAPTSQPWRAKARYDLVATAHAVRVTDILSWAAAITNDAPLSDRYRDRAAEIREAWWRNFGDSAATTQTGCALAICFDLAPDDARARLGDALVGLIRDADTHLATGFLGTPLLLPALTVTGHVDVAYEVLFQTTPPSWLYTVLAGGTTIWERWDALRPDGSIPTEALGTGEDGNDGMVSFNHYAYGAVADWMHTTIAGIAPAQPGYRHIHIEPRPGGGLTEARGELDSRYGRIASAWRIEDGTFHLEVTIPPNTTATVVLPDSEREEIGSGVRTFRSTS